MNNDVLNTSSNAPVLVGIDGSEIALRALDRALTEAAARKVPVRLLCAFPVAVVGDPGLEQRFHDAVKAESESHLEAAEEYARSHAPAGCSCRPPGPRTLWSWAPAGSVGSRVCCSDPCPRPC